MDPLDVLRADFDAYIQGQRRQHSKTSSSTKARSTRVMSPPLISPAPPAVSRAGPIFSPVATHEAWGVAGDTGFPSVFLKQASIPPLLAAFTPAEFRAWLIEFRSFLTRFHLHMFLDRIILSPPAVPDQGAAVVWFLLQQALKPAMTQSTASGRVLHLMLTVLHRRATSPAETLHRLATHLGIATAGEMDQLELTLANFTALPAEPLDQFVWRLHMALDEYNS